MIFLRALDAIRNSSRSFVRAPALALALLLTIALGVGSNASIYGFVQGLTHPDSSLRGAEGIVSILGQNNAHEPGPLSRREYQLLKNDRGVFDPETFDWIDAARIRPADIRIDGHTEIATVADVTPNLAKALNLPLQGGIFISHHLWQSELGSRADVIGARVRVNNMDLLITGVAPSQLAGLYSDQAVDLWIPANNEGLQRVDPNVRDLWVVARIRRPASISRAQADVRLKLGNSDDVSLVPFAGAAPRMALGLSHLGTLLDFAAAAVFLVASINVASFLFGRALKRSHETSLRIALGATRGQLLGELLSDSIVISVAGGALGALLAVFTARALPSLLFQEDAERLVFAPHVLPIVTASMLCVCFTVLCGLMPVFGTVTDRPWIILRREGGLPSKTTERLRTGLVLAQITSCYVLVICAVFLFEGLHSALETSTGKHADHPILVTVQAETRPSLHIHYFSDVEHTAKTVTGQQPLAWAAQLPGDRPVWRSFRIQPASWPLRDLNMDIVWLSTDALEDLGSRLIDGRVFGVSDATHRTAVVDEDTAQQLFGLDSVGMTIEDPSGQPVEIIGVVKRSSTHKSNQNRATIYYYDADRATVPEPIRGAHFRAAQVSKLTSAELNVNVVSPSYFKALDLALAAGRLFPEHYTLGRIREGVINQEAADLYFSNKAVGAGIIDDSGVRTEIVGVVRSRALGRFQQHAEPAIFFPMQQDCVPRMTLMIEGSKVSKLTLANLRLEIDSLPDRGAAPVGIETLDAHLARTALAPLRIATLLSSALALLALALSVLGLVSAQGDAERQRRRELALRIALGAQRWRIVFTVITSAVQTALAGTVIGALVSVALLRLLATGSALFSAPPVGVWLMVALLPTATVLVAGVLPALRASHADPLTIMRDEP